MVSVFKNVGEKSTTKTYHTVGRFMWLATQVTTLYVVSKVSEKLVNYKIVDHLEK